MAGTPLNRFPARTRGLAEDHVRDSLALCERDEALSWTFGLHPHHGGAEALREPGVRLERVCIRPLDPARAFVGHFDVDGIPFRSETPGNPRAGPEHS